MEISTTKLIKLINNLYEVEINRNLKDRMITQSQAEVLIYIKIRNDQGIEVNQVDLERILNLKNPTITGIVKRLENKGLVKRVASTKNSKFKSVLITNLGKEELEKGKKVIDRLEMETLSCFTIEEKQEFRRLLNKLWEHIS